MLLPHLQAPVVKIALQLSPFVRVLLVFSLSLYGCAAILVTSSDQSSSSLIVSSTIPNLLFNYPLSFYYPW